MKKVPIRKCIVCGSYKCKDNFYRLSQLRSNAIIWEEEGGSRLQGKGIYICREGSCRQRFMKEKKFRKRFHIKMTSQALDLFQRIGEKI